MLTNIDSWTVAPTPDRGKLGSLDLESRVGPDEHGIQVTVKKLQMPIAPNQNPCHGLLREWNATGSQCQPSQYFRLPRLRVPTTTTTESLSDRSNTTPLLYIVPSCQASFANRGKPRPLFYSAFAGTLAHVQVENEMTVCALLFPHLVQVIGCPKKKRATTRRSNEKRAEKGRDDHGWMVWILCVRYPQQRRK